MLRIQIILLAGLALAAVLTVKILRRQLAMRLFFLGCLLLGVGFVLRPQTASDLAVRLGVGRGTDLILYFLTILVTVGGLCILRQFRLIERRQTRIIRELAIRNAKTPPGL